MPAEENAYEVLGLQAGPASTDTDIKKAYRKLALVKHPDKNPDNPNAADEFSALQRAYDLLLDPEARAALDGFLKARSVRAEMTSLHDEKRRRMAANLERRERAAEQGTTVEDKARAKLQIEIERLRKAAATRAQNAAQAQQQQQQQQHVPSNINKPPGTAQTGAPGTTAPLGTTAPMAKEMAERLTRTLKVSWSRDGGEYTSPQLRQIFSQHGPVEDVVVKEGRKKKGSALVVMATVQGAVVAGGSVNGELENSLLVVPLAKGREFEEGNNNHVPVAAPNTNTTHPTTVPGGQPHAPTTIKSIQQLGQRPTAPLFAAGTTTTSTTTSTSTSTAAAAAAAATRPQAGSLFAASKPSSGLFPGGTSRPAAHAMPAASGSGGGFSSFKGISSMNGGSGIAEGAHPADPKYEDSTLARLRQEAERKRLIAQMKDDNDEEDD